jgi:hypothetical protein
MKQFEDYKDGDLVYYKSSYEVYQAYKSKYTHNAFRLKGHGDDIVADISEINPVLENYEKFNSDIQRDFGLTGILPQGYVDSDADATGFYGIYDPHGQD